MTRFTLRAVAVAVAAVTLLAVPVFAQTPGTDENDCKPSALMTRMAVRDCELGGWKVATAR